MKDIYRFKIYTTDREGGLAIWVDLPDGDAINIWDLKVEEYTPDVKSALASAFERGIRAGKQLCTPLSHATTLDR